MMDTGDNKIDELFRKSLKEEVIEFDEAHWRDMKKKMEQDSKRRRDIFFWTSLGGVAAMFLMTITWWFTQSVTLEPNKVSRTIPVKKEHTKESKSDISDAPKITVLESGLNRKRDYVRTGKSNPPKLEGVQANTISVTQLSPAPRTESSEKTAAVIAENTKSDPGESKETNNIASEQKNTTAIQNNIIIHKTDSSARVNVSKSNAFRPSVILSVTAAPDLSAVNSFSNSRQGWGGGLLATVTISPVLSVSTGLQLARKIYQTGFYNYKPVTTYVFPAAPSTVDADCRVLDIPLNLNYAVWKKGSNKIEVSGGVSSYFMLEEKYDFKYNYKKPGMRYPGHYEVRSGSNHLMGVGNIAVSYERKLNNKAGIAIQPYVKLPMTDIGFGNVKLFSTGISANLNINLSEVVGRKP